MYRIATNAIRYELIEKRSRFITYLEPVTSREAAMALLERLRLKYPDASHHCWAYIVGNPNSPTGLACSDDGGPSGSAGKPMLQILQYRALGDVMAVVVRYFGGTKLGVGGLVRAYGAAVQQAVEHADLVEQIPTISIELQFAYSHEANVRHLLQGASASIVTCDYQGDVRLIAELAEENLPKLKASLENLTQGRVRIKI